MLNKRLLNVKEAARFLNISPHTLYSWVSQRRIPFVKLGRKTGFDCFPYLSPDHKRRAVEVLGRRMDTRAKN